MALVIRCVLPCSGIAASFVGVGLLAPCVLSLGLFVIKSLFKTPISTWGKIKGERGKASKGEGSRENLHKVLLLRICSGVGVVPSRVIQDKDRTWGAQNDRLVFLNRHD